MAFVNAKKVVYNKAFIDAVLAAYKTVPGAALMAAPFMRLYKNNVQPVKDAPLTLFTECDFSGYASLAAIIGPPLNYSGNQDGVAITINFSATTATPFVDNMVYGVYLTDSPATLWYAAALFDTPVPIAVAMDFVNCRIEMAQFFNVVSEAQF